MFIEIVIGVLIGMVIVYLWTLYLSFGDAYNDTYEIYKITPAVVSKSDRDILTQWGWSLPPVVVSDTYKYTNFWFLYWYSKYM
jgi:hypothetical protein